MDVRPIRNEADLKWALAEIEQYFIKEPEPGSTEADRFDVLATLIEAYESEHWPIKPLPPLEMLREFMTMTGRTQGDLGRLLGHRQRASDILLGKRKLTVEMIARLNQDWGIPSDLLLPAAAESSDRAA